MTADDIISSLNLEPHPEGGWYRQTWADKTLKRPTGTCIYFLPKKHEESAWHRVDAAEIWHFYLGAPLILRTANSLKGPAHHAILGTDLVSGEKPQLIVKAKQWQAARSTGEYTLVGCTVSPGFQFSGFELKDKDFDIPSF